MYGTTLIRLVRGATLVTSRDHPAVLPSNASLPRKPTNQDPCMRTHASKKTNRHAATNKHLHSELLSLTQNTLHGDLKSTILTLLIVRKLYLVRGIHKRHPGILRPTHSTATELQIIQQNTKQDIRSWTALRAQNLTQAVQPTGGIARAMVGSRKGGQAINQHPSRLGLGNCRYP